MEVRTCSETFGTKVSEAKVEEKKEEKKASLTIGKKFQHEFLEEFVAWRTRATNVSLEPRETRFFESVEIFPP